MNSEVNKFARNQEEFNEILHDVLEVEQLDSLISLHKDLHSIIIII